MYVLGTRNFTGASQALTGVGKTDFNAYVGNLEVSYTWGSWLFQGRVTYASGNKANDNINNTSIGNRADVKYYAPMNADGGPFWQQWFENFGNSEVDGTSIDLFQRFGESGGLDRFGWQSLAGAVEYQVSDNLTLEGAAGGFWAAQKTGCPSNVREGSIGGTCLASTPGPNAAVPTFKGEARFNFTGNSRYLGWEVAAGVRYTDLARADLDATPGVWRLRQRVQSEWPQGDGCLGLRQSDDLHLLMARVRGGLGRPAPGRPGATSGRFACRIGPLFLGGLDDDLPLWRSDIR